MPAAMPVSANGLPATPQSPPAPPSSPPPSFAACAPPSTFGPLDHPLPPAKPYTHLTPAEAEHFFQHGWLKLPGAIDRKYLDTWLPDLWVRTGYDPADKSTWDTEYLHMAHHRQERNETFLSAGAWGKIVELCGGEERIHPTRERWVGDNFIVNFGTAERAGQDPESHPPQAKTSFHTDNDWYRAFLDSSGTAMTIVHCFTDIPKKGGGTWLCEDGIKGVCEYLYRHPEGLEPALTAGNIYKHVKDCHQFTAVEAKAGDTFVLHGFLPHTNSYNYLHYPRVITNPHLSLREPYNLNRKDGDGEYSLVEQVILRALGRTSVPEFAPTRPRMSWYPRNATFKLAKIDVELERLKADRVRRGLGEGEVDSVYLRGPEAMEEFTRHNGYDLPINEPAGLEMKQHVV